MLENDWINEAGKSRIEESGKSLDNAVAILAETEQYSRRNFVEIYDIPEEELESPADVETICVGGEVHDWRWDEEAYHCLGKNKSKKGRLPGIIIKFVRHFDKLNKPELSLKHIGMVLVLCEWEIVFRTE